MKRGDGRGLLDLNASGRPGGCSGSFIQFFIKISWQSAVQWCGRNCDTRNGLEKCKQIVRPLFFMLGDCCLHFASVTPDI